MVKTTIKQQLNNIYELQKENNDKMTLKQEQKQKELLLLNDLNYIIDTTITTLKYDYNDNLFLLYDYYINNKYELISEILKKVKNIKVETLQEIATNNGYEFKKILVSKHNINANNEYQTSLLIDDLLKDKINNLIKEYKQEQKTREYLQDNFIDAEEDEENKSPPEQLSIMGLSPLKFLLALIIAIFDVFGDTKKRR